MAGKKSAATVMEAFLKNAGSKAEARQKMMALIFSVTWYEMHLRGVDDKELPAELDALITDYTDKDKNQSDEDYREDVYQFWTSSCGHAASYYHAGIEPQHPFYAALYGLLKALADDDFTIEPIDTMVGEAIMQHLRTLYAAESPAMTYGVLLKGLKSQLVFIPPGATDWTKHADMLVRQM